MAACMEWMKHPNFMYPIRTEPEGQGEGKAASMKDKAGYEEENSFTCYRDDPMDPMNWPCKTVKV